MTTLPIKLANCSPEEVCDLIPESIVLLGYRGSIAHGTYVPQNDPNSIDDKDLMGVFIAPVEHYLGFGRPEVIEKKLREWDIVHYELRKFIRLLAKSNPNVLMMLWLDPKHYLYLSDAGQALIDNRDAFVSKVAYHSFTGYAHSQLKRMTHLAFEGYMGEKRKSLVQKHGYDTKNASHLIRLLKMGIEFLTEGRVHVERKDAAELLAIKRGEWTLEKVQARAEKLFELAEEAYVRSTLPPEPDWPRIERLCVDLLRDSLGPAVSTSHSVQTDKE